MLHIGTVTIEDVNPGNDLEGQLLMPMDENRKHPLSCSTWTSPSLACVKYFLVLPVLAPLSLTMPDIRLANCRMGYTYPLTFVMSIIWMSAMSFGMSMAVSNVSYLRLLRILNLGELFYWIVPQLVVGVMLERRGKHKFV